MDVRVKGSLYETVHGNRNEVIGWKDGSESGGEHAVTVGGSYDLHINQDQYQRVEGVLNESVVGNVVSDFEADAATMVGGKYELNAKEIVLEAANKISLKVGGNFVVIDITGVTIFGTTVRINSGGAGTPTGDHGIDDPLDAATSDTGEPGYLESLRRSGGGGGGGRRHRTLHSQHAPARRKYATPPTLADITSDPYVDAELKRAFEDSNPNAPDVPNGSPGSQKHEQGGWVVWNKNTGELEVVRVPPGDRDGLGTIVGTRPADNADQQTVGWFHTHPNKASEGYGSGPSPGDTGFQNGEAKVPGIIETHDGQKTIPYP